MKRQVMNKLLLAILNPIIYWWIYDTVIYLYLMIFTTFKVNYDFFQVTFYELGPWSKNPTVATNKWEENKGNQTKQRKQNKTKKTKQNKENKTKQRKPNKTKYKQMMINDHHQLLHSGLAPGCLWPVLDCLTLAQVLYYLSDWLIDIDENGHGGV